MTLRDFLKCDYESEVTASDYENIYCELALHYIETIKTKVGQSDPILIQDRFVFFEGLRHSICILLGLESCAKYKEVMKHEQTFVLAMRSTYDHYHINKWNKEEKRWLFWECVARICRDIDNEDI